MDIKKEIIVLSGSGHKGIVRFQPVIGRAGYIKGNCSLDFRPTNTALYIVGNNIAKVILNDIKTEFEVPFMSSDTIGCMVRSSSATMFGGAIPKGKLVKAAEEYDAQQKRKASGAAQKTAVSAASVKTGKNDGRHVDTAEFDFSDTYKSKAQTQSTVTEKNDERESAEADVLHTVDAVDGRPPEWIKYDGNNFYFAIKPQIDEMFICYPEEKILDLTVENSKWVRVDAEDGYYVVGLLYDEQKPSFICYGVPAYEKFAPPKDIENMCVWLPVDESIAQDKEQKVVGYWMIYQSAQTGEIIK